MEGQYNRAKKVNCMMAVSADPQYNMEWHTVWPQDEEGTTIHWVVYALFELIIDQLDIDYPGRSFCFTMDNINIHHNSMIIILITDRGHQYIFWSPYWPVDGPVEYIFNTIHTQLMMYYNKIENLVQLENVLDIIIANIRHFERYFSHIGFPNT